MQIRQLEMLLAMAEQGAYAAAGRQLFISHSAIHRQIRLLEEELGEAVFIRTGRKVQLTEVGRILVDFASKIKQEISHVERKIKDMQILQTGELRIGTGTTAMTFFLPKVLDQLRGEYPNIDIFVETGTADHLIQELTQGKLDVGVASEPAEGFPSERYLHYEHLYKEEFVLAVGKHHRLAKRKLIQWAELSELPLILFTRSSRIRRLIEGTFHSAGAKTKIAMEVENEEAIAKLIEMNFGAGFLSRRRCERERLHVLQFPGSPILLGVSTIVPISYASKKATEFIRICRAHAASLRGPA